MVRIELTSAEATSLTLVLEEYLSDLRMEIADTERMSFREELKQREAFLKALLGRLAADATRP
jgi:hypothetical protein